MNILFSFALLFFVPQTNNPSTSVKLNDQPVDMKIGISLSDFTTTNEKSYLSFTFDKDIDNKKDLIFKIELTVVRGTIAETKRYYSKVRENQKVYIPGLFSLLKAGDDVVLTVSNNLEVKAEILVIRVRK